MNVEFFVNGRRYKTPCPTVLQSEEFSVKIFTDKHFVLAHMINKIVPSRISKMYFEKIDDMSLSSIKCDFHFNNRYNHPKEFLSNIYETFESFLNTSLAVDKNLLAVNRPVYKSTDEVLERIVEIVTATDLETAEAEATTEKAWTVAQFPNVVRTFDKNGKMVYESFFETAEKAYDEYVDIIENSKENLPHGEELTVVRYADGRIMCSETIKGTCIYNSMQKSKASDPETAETEATTEKELTEPVDTHIEDIKKFKEKADLNSLYGEATEPITVHQFERLTKTLHKSLFKAIGIEETRKIPFIISNNMVFFNYNGMQYKYYPSQCKIFKKCDRKYQRINWKDFADDNSPSDQKQALGRSPPLLLI